MPLLILETAGQLDSKTKFQKMAFLAQKESQTHEYNFVRHNYGPYSDGLDLDTVCYPSLFKKILITINTSNSHYSYHITDQGQKFLDSMKDKMDPDIVTTMKNKINELNEKPLYELLEEVYDKFSKECDSIKLENQVKDELSKVIPPIRNSYEKFGNRQTTFVLATLEMIDQILSEAKVKGRIQKDVIFNLSKEIIQKCKDLVKDVIPPTDSDSLRPQFLEINELFHYLVQYCKVRNIAQDPMEKSLDEILNEDEAQRLSQTLLELKLPS